MSSDGKEILTISESGSPLTVELDGVIMPADYSFACVNDFVHRAGTQFEELEALCLGMATHIEKLEKCLAAQAEGE